MPTPRAYALCEDDSVVGTAFYVMEYCDGRVLWDPLLPEIPVQGRRAIYEAKFDVLARLHAVDYAGLGLADFGRPGSYVARQISRWGKQYKASETETIEAMDKLLDWLPAHLPPSDETVLVHGDYRLDNMVFHASEPRVLGVIDWEISTLGDPLAELSYLCMLWRTPAEWGGLLGHDLVALGLPSEPEMVAFYCTRANRPVPIARPLGILHGLQSFPRVVHPPGRLCPLARRHGVQCARRRFGQAGAACRRAGLAAGRGNRRGRPMTKRKPVKVAAAASLPAEREARPSAEREARQPVEAIRAAAFAQFAERGYPVVTVRDIMKACGLTQGALYNHFKSKDELLHDIITSTQAELERQCLLAVGNAGDDPRAQLAAFVRTYVMRHCRLRVEALVANREIGWLDQEQVSDIRRSRRAIRDILVGILTSGIEKGVFDPPKVGGRLDLKAMAMALLDQCTHVSMWYVPGGQLDEDQMATLYAEMALRSVGAVER